MNTDNLVTLTQLREEKHCFDELFPVDTRVILHGLGAGWHCLNTLSGTVEQLEQDPLWSHTIRLDYPFLLIPSSALQAGVEEDKVTIHGSALVRQENVSKDSRTLINQGYGLDLTQDDVCWAMFARVWSEISDYVSIGV